MQMQPQGEWLPAIVKGQAHTPRSYVVEGSNGVYRRNRRYIMKTNEIPSVIEQAVNRPEPMIDEYVAPAIPQQQEVKEEHSPENTVPATVSPSPQLIRRSGRTIKKPVKLDI